MKELPNLRFRFLSGPLTLVCFECQVKLATSEKSHHATIGVLEDDCGVVISAKWLFPNQFGQVDGAILCDHCYYGAAKKAQAVPVVTSLTADIAALRKKAEKQLKSNKDPDAMSTWRQAKVMLETLEMLLKE